MHTCTHARSTHTHLLNLDAGGYLAAHADGAADTNGGGCCCCGGSERGGDGGGAEGDGATKNKHNLMLAAGLLVGEWFWQKGSGKSKAVTSGCVVVDCVCVCISLKMKGKKWVRAAQKNQSSLGERWILLLSTTHTHNQNQSSSQTHTHKYSTHTHL